MRSATIHFRARPDRLPIGTALGIWAFLSLVLWLGVAAILKAFGAF